MCCLGMKSQGIRLLDQERMVISLFLILKTEREFPHIYHFSLTKFKYPRFFLHASFFVSSEDTNKKAEHHMQEELFQDVIGMEVFFQNLCGGNFDNRSCFKSLRQ